MATSPSRTYSQTICYPLSHKTRLQTETCDCPGTITVYMWSYSIVKHYRNHYAIEETTHAESLGYPYLRQFHLPRISVSRKLRSMQYPKDTFPEKFSVKPQRQVGTAAARLNTSALRHTA